VSELVDIACQTMFPIIRKMFEAACHNFETNPKYHIKRFYDDDKLTGFCVYSDEDGHRQINELHYVGKNPFVALKMWRFLSKGAKIIKAQTQKCNTRMVDIMKKLGFVVVGETEYILLFERSI